MDNTLRTNIQNVFGGKKPVVRLRRINRDLTNDSEYSGCSSISDCSLNSEEDITMSKEKNESLTILGKVKEEIISDNYNENLTILGKVKEEIISDNYNENLTILGKVKEEIISDNHNENLTILGKVKEEIISDNHNENLPILGNIKEENISNDENIKTEGTIGEGVKFVDAEFVTQDLIQKKKAQNLELLEKRRLSREAHEKEIQEKQYKRLIHLLTQSKAFSNFISSRFNEELKNKNEKINRKRKKNSENYNLSPSKKEKLNSNFISNNTEIYKNKIKLNLSSDKIAEQLSALSDEENDNKENIESTHNFIQPKYFKGELRDYQKEGVNWLKVLYENGLNGILADEMGLGKTIEIIAFFAHLIEKHICGPFLIIVPLSTLPNWISEFEHFAPQIPVVVCYRNNDETRIIKNKISKKKFISPLCSTYPVVLTTFQGAMNVYSVLGSFHWKYIVIDEAQRIKNSKSKLFKIMKNYKSVNRLLLTGTPLQNNLAELWSLLNFLLPDIFNDLDVFESWFDAKQVYDESGKKKLFKQEEEKQVLSILREILHPFMLRRLKEDVCTDIPLIKEIIVYAPLTKLQYDLYSAVLNMNLNRNYDNHLEVAIVDIDGVRPKRKCTKQFNSKSGCFEIKNVDLNVIKQFDYKQNMNEKEIEMWSKFITVTEENIGYLCKMKTTNFHMIYRHLVNHPYGIYNPIFDLGTQKYFDDILKVSGKLLVLDAMLKNLKSNNHKVLLFSTMAILLDIVEDYLSLTNYKYSRLDGSHKFETRRENIDNFNTDPEVFLFLLTTKAGGVGLNLTAADTVIIYDSDWNPQNDLQAMARCHRIGQTKPVAVYRLCTKGTIDEEIIKRSNAKRFLERAVISKEKTSYFTTEGLLKLKNFLDNNAFMLDSIQKVYTEAELNQLLDRSNW